MRISDWSSDVCSSDLGHLVAVEIGVERRADERVELDRLALDQHRLERLDAETVERRRAVEHHGVLANDFIQDIPDFLALHFDPLLRSEEHTSELQSLMRISYAVFCLKKKNK